MRSISSVNDGPPTARRVETVTSVEAGDPSSVTAPIPVLENRPGWRESFTALGARNYRLYATSQLLDNTGGWMARIAVDWLVLRADRQRRARRAHDHPPVRARTAARTVGRRDLRPLPASPRAHDHPVDLGGHATRRSRPSPCSASCTSGRSSSSRRVIGVAAAFDGPSRSAFVVGDGRHLPPAERDRPERDDLPPRRPDRPGAQRHPDRHDRNLGLVDRASTP